MIGCWLDIAYTIKLRISVQIGPIFEYKYIILSQEITVLNQSLLNESS